MSEATLKLIEHLVSLAKGIIWPLFLLVVILVFRRGLSQFFSRLSEMSFKGAGFEWSAKVAQAAANIEAASVSKGATTEGTPAGQPPTRKGDSSHSLQALASPAMSRNLQGRTVVWVDDKPHGNFYEARALRALGVEVIQVETTASALDLLERQPADLVISDLKRGDDPEAGLKFIQEERRRRPHQRVIVYSGYADPARYARAREVGALGATSTPRELVNLVVTALAG